MEISYDAKAKAMYIKLNDKKIAYTKQPDELIALDFDVEDNIVGIELTYVPSQVDNPFEVIYRYIPIDVFVEPNSIPHRKAVDKSTN